MNKAALLVLLVPFTACHATPASASPPKLVTPSLDVDVEDVAPDHQRRVAHFSLAFVDGKSTLSTGDKDAHYRLEAHAEGEGKLALYVKRNGPVGDLEVTAAIPQKSESPLLVARIERDGGGVTQVVASPR